MPQQLVYPQQGFLVRAFLVAAFMLLLGLVMHMPVAGAGFSGNTASVSNNWGTTKVEPATDLVVTQTCSGGGTGIAYRSHASASGSVTNITVALPAGTAAGDLLVAHVSQRYDASFAVTAPSGWTLAGSVDLGGGATVATWLWHRLATSSEPSSYTFSAGSKSLRHAAIVAYSGVDGTSPVNAYAGAGTTTASTSLVAPSVTTTVSNAALLTFFAVRANATVTPPAGMTERYDLVTGTGASHLAVSGNDQQLSASGGTGTRTATSTVSEMHTALTLALAPAAGGAGASATWTPTVSTWADGYTLTRRNGSVAEAAITITPASASSSSDAGPLSPGITYSYDLVAYAGSWTSTKITASLTAVSC